MRGLRDSQVPLLALIAAFWPVWQWLAVRATSDSSDAWSLISLATALALLWRDRACLSAADVLTGQSRRWTFPILLVALYALSYPFVPPLAHAILAMTAVASACSSLWYDKRMDLRLWGLLLLALPLVPTLNFYLGYPLRVVVGEAASGLLQLNGLAVTRDGTALLWNAKQVSIDAPCSGVKMLWTGLYSSCALASLFRLEAARFVLLAVFATFVVLIANVVRATALFYVEAGFIPQAAPAHETIGVVVFALAAMLIAAGATKLRGVAHAG
jgi:exosortase/archaeosortase family protein